MSLSRRLELLRHAEARQSWILEDDYDSEFRFDSQPLAALRSLDESDRVIYVGTFSKTLFGSMRLGYMVLPAALRLDFINAKYLADICNPVIEQVALALILAERAAALSDICGKWEERSRHAAKCCSMGCGVMPVSASRLRIRMPACISVWLRVYDHAQLESLIDYAHEGGLGLYPIAPHYHARPAIPGLLSRQLQVRRQHASARRCPCAMRNLPEIASVASTANFFNMDTLPLP